MTIENLLYLLVAALVMSAIALAIDVVFVTSKKSAVKKTARKSVRRRVDSAGKVISDDSGSPHIATVEKSKGHSLSWYGTAFGVVAVLLVTGYLVGRTILAGHGPFSNQHEFAVSFVWAILVATLFFRWRYRVRMLSLIVYPIVIALLLYALNLDTTINGLVPALQNSFYLTLHVSFAILAYGTACVSFGAAVLYLVRDKVAPKLRRMPSKDLLDEIGYKAAALTFPLLTIMILLGAIWADTAWGRYWGWDPKETAAFVTWLIYGAYLHARVVRDWRGTKAAWLLVFGFASVLFAYFGNHFFGGLHSYG